MSDFDQRGPRKCEKKKPSSSHSTRSTHFPFFFPARYPRNGKLGIFDGYSLQTGESVCFCIPGSRPHHGRRTDGFGSSRVAERRLRGRKVAGRRGERTRPERKISLFGLLRRRELMRRESLERREDGKEEENVGRPRCYPIKSTMLRRGNGGKAANDNLIFYVLRSCPHRYSQAL